MYNRSCRVYGVHTWKKFNWPTLNHFCEPMSAFQSEFQRISRLEKLTIGVNAWKTESRTCSATIFRRTPDSRTTPQSAIVTVWPHNVVRCPYLLYDLTQHNHHRPIHYFSAFQGIIWSATALIPPSFAPLKIDWFFVVKLRNWNSIFFLNWKKVHLSTICLFRSKGMWKWFERTSYMKRLVSF